MWGLRVTVKGSCSVFDVDEPPLLEGSEVSGRATGQVNDCTTALVEVSLGKIRSPLSRSEFYLSIDSRPSFLTFGDFKLRTPDQTRALDETT